MGTYLLNGGLVVFPLAAALPLVWWRARRRGLSRWAIALQLATVSWAAALVALAFFPLPLPPYSLPEGGLSHHRGWPYPWLSPIPFDTIGGSLEQGWNVPAGRYLIGNIGAFVPLGVLAPMLSPRWSSWPRALVLGLIVSGLVEGTQLAASLAMGFPWRVADVDDLMLNTLGTLIGFGAWAFVSTALGMRPSSARST